MCWCAMEKLLSHSLVTERPVACCLLLVMTVMMCVDIPLCRGLLDVKIDPHRLNCVEFVWDPRLQVETKVAIKIHCISTEFTAKKHGGEKGVPFRVQVETYTHSASAAADHVPFLLHCASCQVKVFKVCC